MAIISPPTNIISIIIAMTIDRYKIPLLIAILLTAMVQIFLESPFDLTFNDLANIAGEHPRYSIGSKDATLPGEAKGKACFRKEDPIPVIFMSLGRSGSSITWDTLSALTGKRNKAYEITGQTFPKSEVFFNSLLENPNKGYDWAVKRLCSIKKVHSDQRDGVIGFQWKPYMKTWDHEYAIEGLRVVGQQSNPPIRIIYLTRNPLDRKLSNIRHVKSKQSNHTIAAHCAVGDEACLNAHSIQDGGYELPVGNQLMTFLRQDSESDYRVRSRLKEMNIQYIHITYEKLYNAKNDVKEWLRIFQFLERGPQQRLTWDMLLSTFSMASIHSKPRNETIANFGQVEQTLKGTDFEYCLYN